MTMLYKTAIANFMYSERVASHKEIVEQKKYIWIIELLSKKIDHPFTEIQLKFENENLDSC